MVEAAKRYNRNREDNRPPLKVGNVVTLAVDRVDRGPSDDPRVAGVVVEVTKHNNYRIGLRAGVLQTCMERGDLQLRPNATPQAFGLDLVLKNWRTMKKIGIRTGAAFESPTGGQGMIICKCKKGTCRTKQCKCFRAKQECGSRCHKGSNCCLNRNLEDSDEDDWDEEKEEDVDSDVDSDEDVFASPCAKPTPRKRK